MNKQTEFQIFKTWLLTVMLSASLTFAATILFAAPILMTNEEIIEFWGKIFR